MFEPTTALPNNEGTDVKLLGQLFGGYACIRLLLINKVFQLL